MPERIQDVWLAFAFLAWSGLHMGCISNILCASGNVFALHFSAASLHLLLILGLTADGSAPAIMHRQTAAEVPFASHQRFLCA